MNDRERLLDVGTNTVIYTNIFFKICLKTEIEMCKSRKNRLGWLGYLIS